MKFYKFSLPFLGWFIFNHLTIYFHADNPLKDEKKILWYWITLVFVILNEAFNYVLIKLRTSENFIKTNGIIFLLLLQSGLIIYTIIYFNIAQAYIYYEQYSSIQALFLFAYIYRQGYIFSSGIVNIFLVFGSIGMFLINVEGIDFNEILVTCIQFGFFGYVLSKKIEFDDEDYENLNENSKDVRNENKDYYLKKRTTLSDKNQQKIDQQIAFKKLLEEHLDSYVFVFTNDFIEVFTNTEAQNYLKEYNNRFQDLLKCIQVQEIVAKDIELFKNLLVQDQNKRFQTEKQWSKEQNIKASEFIRPQEEVLYLEENISLFELSGKMVLSLPGQFELEQMDREIQIIRSSVNRLNTSKVVTNQGYYMQLKAIKKDEDYYLMLIMKENEQILPRNQVLKQQQNILDIVMKKCFQHIQELDNLVQKWSVEHSLSNSNKEDSLDPMEQIIEQIKFLLLNYQDYNQMRYANKKLKNMGSTQTHIRYELEKTIKLFKNELEENQINFILDVDIKIPEILPTNKSQFRRLIACLIKLAVDSTYKGDIQLELSLVNHKYMKIDIIDNGYGYNKNDKQLILDLLENQDATVFDFKSYLLYLCNKLAYSLNDNEGGLYLVDINDMNSMGSRSPKTNLMVGSQFTFNMVIKGRQQQTQLHSLQMLPSSNKNKETLLLKNQKNEYNSQRNLFLDKFELHPDLFMQFNTQTNLNNSNNNGNGENGKRTSLLKKQLQISPSKQPQTEQKEFCFSSQGQVSQNKTQTFRSIPLHTQNSFHDDNSLQNMDNQQDELKQNISVTNNKIRRSIINDLSNLNQKQNNNQSVEQSKFAGASNFLSRSQNFSINIGGGGHINTPKTKQSDFNHYNYISNDNNQQRFSIYKRRKFSVEMEEKEKV